MDVSLFGPNKTGELVPISDIVGAKYAFVPEPLPPRWEWPERLWDLLYEAGTCLTRLDGIGMHLPEPQLLLRPLQNREAQASSRLEGTFTEPQQQLLFQLEPRRPISRDAPRDAEREVYNYGVALGYWLDTRDRLPICLRLIRALHQLLMEGVGGATNDPGNFRTVPVQIGSPPRFVPPPASLIPKLLGQFEHYLNRSEKPYKPLVEAFVAHYQFEAIHPFADGNGRVGRLLLSITIMDWCNLSNQWLYMSPYFDANRDEYIDKLFRVSSEGDWEGWIEFCLRGVIKQAADARLRCDRLVQLSEDFKNRIHSLKRSSKRLDRIADNLFITPVTTAQRIAEEHEVTYPTARADIKKLESAGVVQAIRIEGKREKVFFSPEIIDITFAEELPEETEETRVSDAQA